ncbi:LysR family transcriptional regulator [Pseudomonas sp. NPDC088368]|jgi:DNA-binding transcriptional LysR family regulator|uniref:LysR family transcriptional regulator n=1 Tax=Pseudomonas sp. NPDC088368 TaxID=3364453 RepID=UPI0037F534A9
MERHRQMTVFAAVAQSSGLAAASRLLNVSEATVSRALWALEQRLGTQLLERSTRGVRLTETGRLFAEECVRLLRATDEADASANGLHVEPRGLLTLATPVLFGDRMMMPVVLEYLDAWPGIQMSIAYQNAFPDLHEDGVDVAVLIGELPDAHMVARRVGRVRQLICASPAYLLAHGEPREPVALTDHRLIVCSADSWTQPWRFEPEGGVRHLISKPVLRCTSQVAAIDAALQSAGLVSCLSHEVHEHLEEGRLRAVLQTFEVAPLPVHLIYREGLRASARVRSFIDFAVERLRTHSALSA